MRNKSPTFEDVWSQPRLFWNSLVKAEKQFVVDAMRFENANVMSSIVRENVIIQLNRISNDLAKRVAEAIGVDAPQPDPKYYHDNTTAHIGAFGQKLLKLEGLKIGLLASVSNTSSISQGTELQSQVKSAGVDVVVVAERVADGVNQTYSASDATQFDAVVIADGAQGLFAPQSFTAPQNNRTSTASSLYPAGRPLDILLDAFRFGKTVGALGSGSIALRAAQISTTREGVVVGSAGDGFAKELKDGLYTFKHLDRFALD